MEQFNYNDAMLFLVVVFVFNMVNIVVRWNWFGMWNIDIYGHLYAFMQQLKNKNKSLNIHFGNVSLFFAYSHLRVIGATNELLLSIDT